MPCEPPKPQPNKKAARPRTPPHESGAGCTKRWFQQFNTASGVSTATKRYHSASNTRRREPETVMRKTDRKKDGAENSIPRGHLATQTYSPYPQWPIRRVLKHAFSTPPLPFPLPSTGGNMMRYPQQPKEYSYRSSLTPAASSPSRSSQGLLP